MTIEKNTRIHVATTDGSDGEHKGGVSKAIAKSGDSKAVINAAKTCVSSEQLQAKKMSRLLATQAPPKNMKRKLPKNSANAAY
jgi:hypothetical protein